MEMEKDKTDTIKKKIIYVTTLIGETLVIQVELSENLEGLKDKLQEKSGLKPDQQRLIYVGKLLEDDSRTLRDYDIQYGSTLHLVGRLHGGGGMALEFVDLSKGNFKELEFSETGPDWRQVSPGLNIHGKCQQEKCVTFKNEVICPVEESSIDLVTEKSKIKCPECKNMIEMDSCGFYSCFYSIEGKKYDDATGGIIDFKVENQNSGEKYKYFGSDINGKTMWIKLKITVRTFTLRIK